MDYGRFVRVTAAAGNWICVQLVATYCEFQGVRKNGKFHIHRPGAAARFFDNRLSAHGEPCHVPTGSTPPKIAVAIVQGDLGRPDFTKIGAERTETIFLPSNSPLRLGSKCSFLDNRTPGVGVLIDRGVNHQSGIFMRGGSYCYSDVLVIRIVYPFVQPTPGQLHLGSFRATPCTPTPDFHVRVNAVALPHKLLTNRNDLRRLFPFSSQVFHLTRVWQRSIGNQKTRTVTCVGRALGTVCEALCRKPSTDLLVPATRA